MIILIVAIILISTSLFYVIPPIAAGDIDGAHRKPLSANEFSGLRLKIYWHYYNKGWLL